ncbi:MAG TPA: CHRD domain-containing protein [Rhodothermales bacterium]|nr:CHRD domain-containing protein [Rhodothermales bacterium]
MVFAGCSNTEETANEVGETATSAADNLPGVGETSLSADLTGAAEVPGPADPDGSGSATVSLDEEDGEVCYDIDVENIGDPVAAHIHTGAAGVSGPPVVTFPVADEGLDSCVSGVDQSVVQDIANNPANYYVNVHTAEFPSGAIRGQLEQ